jgi:biopolymer transport protein ExbD
VGRQRNIDPHAEANMNFRRSSRDEPEINLIPFIDVLLVVLIFLMLSTTYSKFTELQLKLPVM